MVNDYPLSVSPVNISESDIQNYSESELVRSGHDRNTINNQNDTLALNDIPQSVSLNNLLEQIVVRLL